ncbi:2-oxoglutarate dehydrogenase complex dihydrolipoyllysine-residue succinyltransferase [Oceanibacterium hippocampi]|uniref:Dihydrolipoyllysine-residue succinyltransferase component of 2-oxoglutarate dehydrogenase complex n=1 Tax=Oceanibacterium hippocampi TaxID=745714 RepID=A0A1Y5RG14_9PROT|nr:2-oxoglutarate dehydrogenase complex dihydrolipoyllysine-residue succinyltransferase [Oceanibacterium hippocampi]SLN13824.1 Dihydrolipoyllysine-residue succinyltransferase component of 2-oxoglutarate dehydrogenase complex [Oceanibacterium hippocampi]
MTVEIRVPTLGESVTEATIGQWFKKVGEAVARDEPLVELETDKVTVEVNAAEAGTLTEIVAAEGETVEVGALIGSIDKSGKAAPAAARTAKAKESSPAAKAASQDAPKAASEAPTAPADGAAVMPAAAKLIAEKGLDAAAIEGTGKDGRVTKGDVIAHMEKPAPSAAPAPAAKAPAKPAGPRPDADREERVRMSRLRQRIAERLKEAQNTAAMLTTFNEVDMTSMMEVRNEYRESFEKKHGVRLGFMSFFVKASIAALKELPAVNAEIEGDEIVYKNYYNIGVAVGTPSGLVVPVLRDADKLGFAEIEQTIGALGKKARDGKLGLDDLQGGTFTISNGGVYGSLLSTPILNPPQSAILGMHKVQQRPMVVDGQVVVRPMMYLALSYDHRIVDGREAVTTLVRIKENLEDPRRLLLDL